MDGKVEEIKPILKKYGQEHLLNNYDKLDENKKQKLVEQLSNVDVNNNDEYYKVRDKVTDIIRTSTWDDYFELSSKLRQIDDNRAAKFADEKRAKEAARVQHLEAFRKAQERYSQLSIFGKLKSIIQKKDIRHIDARDFSTEELNNMYVTSGRTK